MKIFTYSGFGILTMSVLSLFFFISGMLPVLGFFLMPLAPACLILLFLKNNRLAGIAGIAVALLMLFSFFPDGRLLMFLYIVLVVLPGIIFYFGIKTKLPAWKIIAESAAVSIVIGIVIAAVFASQGFQFSWILQHQAYSFPQEALEYFTKVITEYIYAITSIFLVLYNILAYVYLSAGTVKSIAPVEKLPSFKKWRLPEWIIFVFIGSLFLFLAGRVLNNQQILIISENLILFNSFMYFGGGFAITAYFLNKSRVMLFIAYTLLLLYPPMSVFLGITDIWLNYRTRGNLNEDHTKGRS